MAAKGNRRRLPVPDLARSRRQKGRANPSVKQRYWLSRSTRLPLEQWVGGYYPFACGGAIQFRPTAIFAPCSSGWETCSLNGTIVSRRFAGSRASLGPASPDLPRAEEFERRRQPRTVHNPYEHASRAGQRRFELQLS